MSLPCIRQRDMSTINLRRYPTSFLFFFIIIVVLMTSNTMSRMIVEERSEMGTFASLGITNKRIILTIWFMFYQVRF